MKKIMNASMILFLGFSTQAQTEFKKTSEQFKNREFVWNVVIDNSNQRIGEFWPIHGLNLVTKKTDPEVFAGDITKIQKRLGGVATAPDGMTGGSFGSYEMQGKSLSHGRPCGDGFVYDYGLILVDSKGFKISFSHKREHKNFDSLYSSILESKATMFFLPSIFRNGKYLSSNRTIDKVLIRRETHGGEQIGVIVFDRMVTYNEAREIILGLDRKGYSKTTHIYVLDGGSSWGQSCKEVNGQTIKIGTRNPDMVTNYLVFY